MMIQYRLKYYHLMDQVLNFIYAFQPNIYTCTLCLTFCLSSDISFSGLPFNRQDTFLCVITRTKHADHLADIPRKRKYSGRVHFGSSPEALTPPVEKKPVQVLCNNDLL